MRLERIRKWIAALVLGAASVPAGAMMCNGPIPGPLAPIMYMNVMNMFPITIAGVSVAVNGASRNCPSVTRAPVCVCPGILGGLPTPGVMLTMHIPQYVAEITGQAGCSPLLAGQNILGHAFYPLSGGPVTAGGADTGNTKRHVHWVEYPLFTMLEMFMDMICMQGGSEMDIAYMTEFDPLWNDGVWGGIFNPEAVLFGTLPMVAACAADAISTTFLRCSLDPLIWCSGAQHLYPWTGIQPGNSEQVLGNVQTLNRFMHRHARTGMLWRTVGPDALCNPVVSPVMVPSQYRLDLIYPNATTVGRPLALGTNAITWGTVANTPFQESSVFLIWVAQQCCLNI